MKTKKKLKKNNFIIVLFILFFLIMMIISIYYISQNLSLKKKFIGTWTTDGITIYEFKKDNTGFLKVPLDKYKFKYKIKKNYIFIDIENKDSVDVNYKYTFKNGKLILSGKKGKFIFRKLDE